MRSSTGVVAMLTKQKEAQTTLRGKFVLLFLALLVSGMASALAQSTAFSYQGWLRDNGAPPTGTYDLQFKLYDAATAGAQIGSTIAMDDVAVTNGLFNVALDFGAGVFAGADRWLDWKAAEQVAQIRALEQQNVKMIQDLAAWKSPATKSMD